MAIRRPLSLREQLRLERAKRQTMQATLRQMSPPMGPLNLKPGPVELLHDDGVSPFVQIVAVGRNYASILHALDASGQVWELETVLGDKIAGKQREVLDQFWKKVEMKRR